MAHLTPKLERITVGQTDFSPLETSPGRPFVLPPHTVGSTVITKEEEKNNKNNNNNNSSSNNNCDDNA